VFSPKTFIKKIMNEKFVNSFYQIIPKICQVKSSLPYCKQLENIFFELLPNQIYAKLAHHLEFCLQSFLDTFGPQRPGFVGDGSAGFRALNTLCKIK
jgi:hypothetical protein